MRSAFALMLFGFAGLAAVARPAQAGQVQSVYVIVDPYSKPGMEFLSCAANGKPQAAYCKTLSASGGGFSNPFVPDAAGNVSANGILLRVPWCGFETDSQGPGPAYRITSQNSSSCHYSLESTAPASSQTAGTDAAGAFAAFDSAHATSSNLVETPHNQLMGLASQTETDTTINWLSVCQSTQYDECSTSILYQALGYIAQIEQQAQQATGRGVSLSIGLASGRYTPRSVLQSAGFVDLPIQQKNQSYCERQPLAYGSAYMTAYTNAVTQLLADVTNYPYRSGTLQPFVSMLKVAPLTKDDLEFSVPAELTKVYATPLDPGQMGDPRVPPQDFTLVSCPDHEATPEDSATALVDAYHRNPVSGLTLEQAYEQSFGYAFGFEAGLATRAGSPHIALSVGTMGDQAFAHVYCGPDGASTCVRDPAPHDGKQPLLTGLSTQYSASVYYFALIFDDLFDASGKPEAYVSAQSGYDAACLVRGKNACSPANYAVSPSSLYLVWTGLTTADQMAAPGALVPDFQDVTTCWLNNIWNSAQNTQYSTIDLYSSPVQSVAETILGPQASPQGGPAATSLGWQTATGSGTYCDGKGWNAGNTASYANILNAGLQNGGQFFEIETDAASEPKCGPALSYMLSNTALWPNTSSLCAYIQKPAA